MSARTVRESRVYEKEIDMLMHRCSGVACSAIHVRLGSPLAPRSGEVAEIRHEQQYGGEEGVDRPNSGR